MEWLKTKTEIDFMGRRRFAMMASAALLAVALLALLVRGLAFGIDFTGGTIVEVGFGEPVELATVREALASGGYGDGIVQHFGTPKDVLIRLAPQTIEGSAGLGSKVVALLQEQASANVELRRVEFVGPQVGSELATDGGLALLLAILCILIYVALRFEWRFALGSVAALLHDVFITLGFFALFQFEFDLTVLAALLAVIGYSLNDTIVVFDRIRENFRKIRKGLAVDIVNISINQTLARTIMTSVTTLLVLLSLYFFGGEVMNKFALALIIGVLVGTYSSIYVASSTALALGISKADLMPVQKEGAELDRAP